MATQDYQDPYWWGGEHESTWTRIKDALRRDWEQTKKDFGSDKAVELDQSVSDTVKQAGGSQAFPKSAAAMQEEREDAREEASEARVERRPTMGDAAARTWDDTERSMRFGAGAAFQFPQYAEWNDGFERQLRADWEKTNDRHGWPIVRDEVRKGFQAARRQ